MTEELQNTICTGLVSSACVACCFLVTQCAIKFDATSEARRMEDQKAEAVLDLERAKQGLEYIERGSWVKRDQLSP
jgi:hypothetical protein